MPKNLSQWQKDAAEAADRINKQHAQGEQLALLPDEVDPEPEARGKGRPPGSKNKVSTQMREYLAARGCRLPEDVLIEVAGLNNKHDLVTLAMAQTERVLAWAFDGAHIGKKGAPAPTASMRLDTFKQQYTMILRAAEALLPYMAPKATPDVNVNQNTTVIVPAQPSQPADPAAQARDVTPQTSLRMMPADVRAKMEQKQDVSDAQNPSSDAETRTEGPSD